jgi:hypothetical protein
MGFKSGLAALVVLFVAHASAFAQESVANEVGGIDELFAPKVCVDNRDCMPLVEHCLNHICERLSRKCTFNYECSPGEVCRNGQCRP